MWFAVRFRRIFPALAVLGLTLSAAAEPASDAVIAEAGMALEAGDAAHALELANSGLRGETSSLRRGRLLLDRGLAHELLGAHDEALQDFTGAIETHALPAPERGEALLQRGFLLDGLDQLEDAAKDYGAVIALKSGNEATALNNRANIRRRQGRLAEARHDYQAALATGATKAQYPYYGLGQIAEIQHDVQAARGFYARAVAADPGYSLAADRLTALGGPPDGVLAEPNQIILRPPGAKPTPAHPSETPRQEASPNGEPSILPHLPLRRTAKAPTATGHAPMSAASLGLRPALDGPSAASGPQVQLGAWRSEPEAQAGWEKARGQAGRAFDGLNAHVMIADLPGKGRYFRLRVATPDPAKLCATLRDSGVGCLPVR